VADLLEVYYLCLLLGFRGRYAAGGDLRSIMGAIQDKILRVRGPAQPLSPRGAIPADAVRLVQSDRWSRILGRTALIAAGVVIALFVVFKVLLMSGVSSLSELAAGLLK
jgi:type VI secretion system protein ImpK